MNVSAAVREFVASKPLLARAMGNTGWLLGEQLPRKVVGLLVGTWIARYLTPSGFGELTYAFAFLELFLMVGALGLPNILVRELAAHPGDRDEILGTATLLRLAGNFAAAIAGIATIGLARPGDAQMRLFVFIIAAAFIPQCLDTIDSYFKSGLTASRGVVPRTTAFAIFTVIRIWLLLAKVPLVWFVAAGGAEVAAGALGLAVVYRLKSGSFGAWRVSAARARELLQAGWPLILNGLAVTLFMRMSIVMLGAMASDKEVGVYSAAESLAESWLFLPVAINATMLPVMAEAFRTSEALFEEHVDRYYRFAFGVALAVVIGGSIIGPFAIPVLFGPAYAASVPMFVAILATSLISCLGLPRGAHWLVRGWQRMNMESNIAGAVVNILANLLLIPRLGAWGAVIATAVSYWTAVFGWCLLVKETRPTALRMARAMLSPRLW